VTGYVIIIEGDQEGGFSAWSPDLLGCIATGSTYDECLTVMREAMAGHLAVMREYGDPIPEPSAVGATVTPAA
jgi:predicted RNase H-like HicB family nuclease